MYIYNMYGPQFSAVNFFQIPHASLPNSGLTVANFPHIPINFRRLRKPTKYAVFVIRKLPQLTDTVCLPNKQAIFQTSLIFSNIPHVRTREAVMNFTAQLRLLVVINFQWPPKTDQNMLYFPFSAGHYRIPQNSAEM